MKNNEKIKFFNIEKPPGFVYFHNFPSNNLRHMRHLIDLSPNLLQVFVTLRAALKNCLPIEAKDAGVDEKYLAISAKFGKIFLKLSESAYKFHGNVRNLLIKSHWRMLQSLGAQGILLFSLSISLATLYFN